MKLQLSPETCATTWWTAGAITAILSNYSTLCTVLHEINQTGRDEYAMKLVGIWEKFSTYFGLKLSLFVFSVFEQLSETLQEESTSLQEAKHASKLSEN